MSGLPSGAGDRVGSYFFPCGGSRGGVPGVGGGCGWGIGCGCGIGDGCGLTGSNGGGRGGSLGRVGSLGFGMVTTYSGTSPGGSQPVSRRHRRQRSPRRCRCYRSWYRSRGCRRCSGCSSPGPAARPERRSSAAGGSLLSTPAPYSGRSHGCGVGADRRAGRRG